MAMPLPIERDVEDDQPGNREPERALGQPFARQRPADDARQRVASRRPVASSVPPPTIIRCVFERSRTR